MSNRHLTGGAVRKLQQAEQGLFANHLLRLDPEARRLRYAHGVSDQFIIDYAQRMLDNDAVVYGYVVDGEVRAAAELRKMGDTWHSETGQNEAEAAFSVEADHQGHGIGTELMGRIIRAARNRGVQHLYMSCMAENHKMQAIARKHEAELRFEYGEVIGEIVPATANYFSLLTEAVEDRVSVMLAVLDLRKYLGAQQPEKAEAAERV